MNDMQLLTIVLTLLAIFASVFFNRKAIEDMRDVLRAEAQASKAEAKAQYAAIDNKLDHLLEVVARHSERLDK